MRPHVSRPARGALALALALLALLPAAAPAQPPRPRPRPGPPRPPTPRPSSRAPRRSCCGSGSTSSAPSWVQSNFITDDTEALSALANERMIAGTMRLAAEATRFDGLALPPDVARKLKLIKLSIVTPAPADPALRKELTEITTSLESDYGKGKYCPPGKDEKACQDLEELSATMAASRDPQALLEAWQGWHTVSPPMRERLHAASSTLANQGAQDLGFADLGALWRAGYDMTPDEFAKEVDRLWLQVKPLYDGAALLRPRPAAGQVRQAGRARTASRSRRTCWATCGPRSGATSTTLVAPPPRATRLDVTALLKPKKVDALEMVRIGERFFPRSGCRSCRRPSGSARCSSSRATARSSATPARGTSTSTTTCG